MLSNIGTQLMLDRITFFTYAFIGIFKVGKVTTF